MAAGFLEADASDDDLKAVITTRDEAFVVIDYAETRHEHLVSLLKAAARRSSGARLRIALVARQIGDWWPALQEADSGVQTLLAEYVPHRLQAVSVDLDQRGQVFRHAMATFASVLGKRELHVGEVSFKDPRFERILYLHLAALAAVEGRTLAAEDLLRDAVAHEVRFWTTQTSGTREFKRRASRLVTALTLRGRTARSELRALDERVEGPGNGDFRDLMADLYPSPAKDDRDDVRLIGGLQPDLLGEAIIKATLVEPETPEKYLEQVFQCADSLVIENGFVVLGRLSLRAREQTDPWIERFLSVNTLQRALPAFNAALSLGDSTAEASLGMILATTLRRTVGAERLAPLVEDRVPHATVSLREVALWATLSRVILLSAKIDETDDEHALGERARLMNNLGNRLRAVGRREDALSAAEEAVTAFRALAAKASPDAILPDLPFSLTNLAARLSELGRFDEALSAIKEAVEIQRTLARLRPDAILPDLAGSLNNMGIVLGKLGRGEEALSVFEEAVEIQRTLTETRPDALPELAKNLTNLAAARLSRLDCFDEALSAIEEAVEIRRTLAKARSDAFLPDLASSLTSLGVVLSKLGRREEALSVEEEAVEIRRTLARARSDAFLPDLALSLNNQGLRLSELGRREDALQVTREAVQAYTVLTNALPEAFSQGLMVSLQNYRARLFDNGVDAELDSTFSAAMDALRTIGVFSG